MVGISQIFWRVSRETQSILQLAYTEMDFKASCARGGTCVPTNRRMHNQIDISEAGASLVTGIRQVPVEDNDQLLMVV